jgi:hypothetical protein
METLSRACDRGVTPFATDSAMSESDLGWRRGDAGDGGGDRAGPSAERRQGCCHRASRWIIAGSGGGAHRSRLGFIAGGLGILIDNHRGARGRQ